MVGDEGVDERFASGPSGARSLSSGWRLVRGHWSGCLSARESCRLEEAVLEIVDAQGDGFGGR